MIESVTIANTATFGLTPEQLNKLSKIAAAKAELDALTKRLETLTLELQGADGTGGKKGELSSLEIKLKERCWSIKQKHDAKLKGAFEGSRNSSEKFKDKVLRELASNKAALLSLADLEKTAESLFGATPTTETAIATVD